MIKENEIRAELVKYLAGNQALDAFEDWLVQWSWNMHRDSDQVAQGLASKIELLLAEYSGEHIDESTLKEKLRPFVSKYNVSLSLGAAAASSSSVVTSTSSNSMSFQQPFVGITTSKAFVS